jgi:hypothetical protein
MKNFFSKLTRNGKHLLYLDKEKSPVQSAVVDFIFIHIIKTAGTSVGKAVNLKNKLHLPAKEIIRRIGKEEWNAAFKFAFVRNPWDKTVSHYKYNIKRDIKQMRTNPISFRDWVWKTIGDDKDYFYYNRPMLFAPQIEWLLDDNDELNIDYIGRFENLHADFAKIAKVIGVPESLPFLNTTKKINTKPYSEYYDSETKELIAKVYKKDIEKFGYSF